MYNLTGEANNVIVTIEEGLIPDDPGTGGSGEEEGGSPNISFGYYYTIPFLFGTILLALMTRRRSHTKSK